MGNALPIAKNSRAPLAVESASVGVGRNDPCPCSSGKKFKKCCGRSTHLEVAAPVEESPFDPVESFWFARRELAHERCPPIFGNLLAAAETVNDWVAESSEEKAFESFLEAEARYAGVLEEIVEEDADVDGFLDVRTPFDLDADPSGRPPAALFLERFHDALPADAVRAVEALLAGEDAFVAVERKGKQTLLRRLADDRILPTERTAGRAGDILLGRLVEIADHFCLFTPEKFSGVSREECLGLQQTLAQGAPYLGEVGLTSSRKPAFSLQLVSLMVQHGPPEEDSGEEPKRDPGKKEGRRQIPVVTNADGHLAVLTTSSFELLDLDGLARELARPPWNADLETEEAPDGKIRKLTAVLSRRPKKKIGFLGGQIILATLRADRETLRLETNSVERDFEVRRRLDCLPSGILRFRETTSRPIEKELEKPLSGKERRRLEKEHNKPMRHPEVRRRFDEMMRDSSLRWCDESIPALGNRKPRKLVKTEAGRTKVLALLEEMESRSRLEESGGMDFVLIRRELGLPLSV